MTLKYLVAGALCASCGPALADGPSFDCGRAESSAEEAVCSDPALAELDRELARIYRLAVDSPTMSDDRLNELKAMQRGWIKGRDDCWKSDLGVPECTARSYAFRIIELRQNHAAARAEESNGISQGPFPWVCDGLGAVLGVGFLNGIREMVTLQWGENAIALTRVPAASGIRYEGAVWGAPALFHSKGDVATFLPPGASEVSCMPDDMG